MHFTSKTQNIVVNLTKNDRYVIKYLLQDASISDNELAKKLKLSAQAIKKIRKKLHEKSLIEGYEPILNYGSFGLNILSILLIKVTPNGWKLITAMGGEAKIAKSIPNIIGVYKTQSTDITHIVICGFNNISEFNDYVNIIQPKLINLIEIKESYNLPVENIVKDSYIETICSFIDSTNGFSTPWTIDKVLKNRILFKKSQSADTIKFTDNEKVVLKCLIENCRVDDTKIANISGITAKSVGKIKKNLENAGIIKGYTLKINLNKLGINTLAIAFIEPVMDKWHILRKKGIYKYMMHPNIIKSYNLTSEKYAVFFVFRDLDELDRFFHDFQLKLSPYLNIRNIIITSFNSLIKDNSNELMVQMSNAQDKNNKSKMELAMYLTLVKNTALKNN